MPLTWIIIAILALPVAELGVYLLVASEIGFFRAFLLQLACSAVGFVVLRRTGQIKLARWQAGFNASSIAGLDADAGGAALLGGILLFIPGFITDAVGAALVVPPLRRGLGALIRHVWARSTPRAPADAVIDLKPTEWREIGTRKRVRKPNPKRQP